MNKQVNKEDFITKVEIKRIAKSLVYTKTTVVIKCKTLDYKTLKAA